MTLEGKPSIGSRLLAFSHWIVDSCRERASCSYQMIDRHWPGIDRVAQALLVRPILNGADLDELIRDPASIALR